jgi:hypothetical protein
VTGWQGNEGQGGWNQPPQGGDPYNPDPYGYQAGPHGTAQYPYGPSSGNPYQTGDFPAQSGYDPYAPDQYGQYGQQNPYQTGGFPAQGFPPPPPPRRSKLPMVLAILAIVIIVGTVVTIVLVNRSGGQTASPADPSARERPSPQQTSGDEPPPSSAEPGGQDGWQTVDNTSDAGLTYQVPPDWKVSETPRASGLDVDFTGTAEYGIYDCGGGTYVRSFATSGDVQSKDGEDLDVAKTVSDFAQSFGTGYFKDTAQIELGTPEKTEIGGREAVKVTAPVTPQVADPKCEAAKGEVAIVGVLLEQDGQPSGVAMLVVVSDVEGGPDDPKSLPTDVAQDILDSARVGG